MPLTAGDITGFASGIQSQLTGIQQQSMQNEVTMAKNQEALQLVNDEVNLQNTAKQGEQSASRGQ